jgi:hypothetical protein
VTICKYIEGYEAKGMNFLIPSEIRGYPVTQIESECFERIPVWMMSSMNSITVEATTPPILNDNYLVDGSRCNIYVPSASVDAYKRDVNWGRVKDRIFGY